MEDVKISENPIVSEDSDSTLVQNEEKTPDIENKDDNKNVVTETRTEALKVEDVMLNSELLNNQKSDLDIQTEKIDETTQNLSENEPKLAENSETEPEITAEKLNIDINGVEENISNEKTKVNVPDVKQMSPLNLFNKNQVQNTDNNDDQSKIASITDKITESSENDKNSETNSYANDVPIVENTEKVHEEANLIEDSKENEETFIPERQTPENILNSESESVSSGFFDGLLSYFSSAEKTDESSHDLKESNIEKISDSYFSSHDNKYEEFCTNDDCKLTQNNRSTNDFFDLDVILSSNVLLYLVTTALSVILFLLGYTALDKSKHVSPLVARINQLEQQLIITMKENELLQEKLSNGNIEMDGVPSEAVQELNQRLADMQIAKAALEEQVQSLEKELDTSTEVGIELNRILSEILSSSNANDTIKENVEQLQRQLVEQQDTINTVNDTLSLKETENHELHLELEISSKKVTDLQCELDKMVDKLLRIEEERDQQQSILEAEIAQFRKQYDETAARENALKSDVQLLNTKLAEVERVAEVKIKEYNVLKDSLKHIKSIKNDNNTLKSLLDVSSIKAEMEQLKVDNKNFIEKLKQEQETKELYINQAQTLAEETKLWRSKFEQVDKEKLEVKTKLDVLNNYFKEKEAQLQKYFYVV